MKDFSMIRLFPSTYHPLRYPLLYPPSLRPPKAYPLSDIEWVDPGRDPDEPSNKQNRS